ncbi:MAG: hypothetical protein R2794_06165 [Chitinophagales bacterium]
MHKPLPFVVLVLLCALTFTSCTRQRDTQNAAVAIRNSTLEEVPSEPENVPPVIPVKAAPEKKPIAQLERMLRTFGPKAEHFTYDPQLPIHVDCAKGSTLDFDPGSFVYSGTQTPVTSPVDIEVTEYLTESDFILGGLATLCGKELLETGGMLFIAATADGRDVEIKDGMYYNITLPSATNKDGMQLFYGEEGSNGTNWLLAARGTLMENQKYNSFYTSDINVKYWKEEPSGKVNFPGGIKKMYEYLHERMELPPGFENVKLHATSYVNITVDAKGKLSKIYTPKQIKTYGDEQLVDIFSAMPDWEASLHPSEKKKLLYPVKLDYVRDPSQITITENASMRVEKQNYSAMNITDGYLLTASKLGWINCDRFVQPGNELVAMFIPVDSTVDATLRIVFKDIRSVMGGIRYSNGFVVTNVPKDEPITIISMIQENGKVRVAMQETTVEERTYAELIYKDATKDDLQNMFESLNEPAIGKEATAMR